MRLSTLALAAVLATLAPDALAGEPPAGAAPAAAASGEPPVATLATSSPAEQPAFPAEEPIRSTRSGLPRWGLAVGGGFPDFANASLVYRPIGQVRLSAGPSWNYVGWGVHGGLTVAPWSFFLTPTLSVDAGRFFRGDLSFLAKDKAGVPSGLKPLLEAVDYSFASVDLGLEIGSPRGFSTSLRFGLSYVAITANGTASWSGKDGSTVSFTNPTLRATLPSVKLGFQYWF